MNIGSIQSYTDETGYGFIRIDEALKRELGIPYARDLFFHASGVAGNGSVTLMPGDQVSFEIRRGRRGPEGHEVKVIARTGT